MIMDLLTVIITGANRGIGFELTKSFLGSGQWKVLACCRDTASAQELQELAKNSGHKIGIYQLDVADELSVKDFAARISGKRVDILLNNAGISGDDRQSVFDMNFDAWLDTFKVNTMAPLRMVQAVMDNLRLSDQPKIVTISSRMGSLSHKGNGHYAYRSSKAAVNKVMQVLSQDLEDENIIVSLMHPGWVQTDMGGKGAEITPQESAAALFKVITALKKTDSGRFLEWTGEELPW